MVGNRRRTLARQIRARIEDYLRFATDRYAPLDNNAVVQEIRLAKLRQAIPSGKRTLAGSGHFAALRSYTVSAAKHGIDALIRLATDEPWLPATTLPVTR